MIQNIVRLCVSSVQLQSSRKENVEGSVRVTASSSRMRQRFVLGAPVFRRNIARNFIEDVARVFAGAAIKERHRQPPRLSQESGPSGSACVQAARELLFASVHYYLLMRRLIYTEAAR